MMYLFHAIDDAYFTGTDYVACEGDYVLEETNINISTPVAASGEMNLEGNINLNTAIKALETITLTGEVKIQIILLSIPNMEISLLTVQM